MSFLPSCLGSTRMRTLHSCYSPASCTAPFLSSAPNTLPTPLYLNPTGPAKSHMGPLKVSAKSQILSRKSSMFPSCKVLSLPSSWELIKKAPQILSSLLSADVCNSETISGLCYLYLQTLNSLKSGAVS